MSDRSALVNQVNARASAFARQHSAELVTQIDDATRSELQSIIADGLEDGIGSDKIAEMIEQAYAFSDERAELIADTEIRRANSQGALDGYHAARDSGIAVMKEWLPDTDPCPECQDNADEGPIDLDDSFPSGDDAPPAHPNCECSILPVVQDEEGNETESDEEE